MMTFKGHTYSHNKDEQCKKCGKIHTSGNLGKRLSEEILQKMRESSYKPECYKKRVEASHTPKAIAKRRETILKIGLRPPPGSHNVPHTEQTKQKLSDIQKELFATGKRKPSFKGKHHTEETKRRISEKKKGIFARQYERLIRGKISGEYLLFGFPTTFCDVIGIKSGVLEIVELKVNRQSLFTKKQQKFAELMKNVNKVQYKVIYADDFGIDQNGSEIAKQNLGVEYS